MVEYTYDATGNQTRVSYPDGTAAGRQDENNTMKGLSTMGKNGETRCASCGTPCQGFKGPDGRILCWDCYKKIWGKAP